MMENTLFAVAILLFLVGAVLAVIVLVRDLMKNKSTVLRRIYLSCLAVSLLLMLIGFSNGDPATLVTALAVLCVPIAVIWFVIGLIQRIRKKTKKKYWLVPLVLILAVPLLLILSSRLMNVSIMRNDEIDDYIEVQVDPDFEVVDGTEPLEPVTSSGFYEGGRLSSYRKIYDAADLPLLIPEDCGATASDCLRAIRENPELGRRYQEFFSDFVRRIDGQYPDADLSILYHNLKTLRVVELGHLDYITKSLSGDSYGCYMRNENVIYIPKGTKYVEGEWGFQVLLHEFCHAARTMWRDSDAVKDRIEFCVDYDTTLLEECMNSVFSCSLLNYDERDIAYQVPSNYLSIMLSCMDNYDLADYFNHSDRYFLSRLDETTGHTNYAQVIWKLITLQRSDWQDDTIDIPQEQYEPIYEYLCELYYAKHITPDMSATEREAVAAELVDLAFYDAPEGFETEPEFFYEYAWTFEPKTDRK